MKVMRNNNIHISQMLSFWSFYLNIFWVDYVFHTYHIRINWSVNNIKYPRTVWLSQFFHKKQLEFKLALFRPISKNSIDKIKPYPFNFFSNLSLYQWVRNSKNSTIDEVAYIHNQLHVCDCLPRNFLSTVRSNNKGYTSNII